MTSQTSRAGQWLLGWLGVACVALGLWLYARQYTADSATHTRSSALPPEEAAEPLPFDADVLTGTLKNGLRYFVRANPYPDNRAELRLVINAGSVLEDDDQRGLAHFVEHMAFNGTRRFPKQAVGQFMESIGMRFGPGVNATTSFDETVYRLQIPTDDPAIVDRALMILEDWAHLVEFDPAEIERERPVVIEEWRARRGAGARVQDAQLPVLLRGSKYPDRVPIGTPETLASFDPARLRQFYRDWYRPDLMAVIVVGDFEADAMAARVRERFAAIPGRADAPARPTAEIPDQPGTEFVVVSDPELTATSISIAHKRRSSQASTLGDYRDDLVDRLAIGMLSTRLAEIAQTAEGPFLRASAGRGQPVRGLTTLTLTATVPAGGALRGVTALGTERTRLARHGFTDEELKRQRAVVERGLERALAQASSRPSPALAAEYVRHVTTGEPVPGLAWEVDAAQRLLPGVTPADVNRAALAWLGDDDRVVMVSLKSTGGSDVPTADALRSALASAARASVRPWVARPVAPDLLEELPVPGGITAATTDDALGLTEWTLSNGAVVVLLPTSFKEDEVVFRAVAPGGLSLADDSQLVAAQTSVQVVTAMGFGRLASGDLRRALTGRVVAVQPIVGQYDHGFAGTSAPADLEIAFQLIHLMMTAPRRDARIFQAVQAQMRDGLENRTASPDVEFAQAISEALSNGHPRVRRLTPDALSEMDLDRSLAFYRQRFTGASGFTFVFTGSFEPELMRPLVERYLASVPALPAQGGWRDRGIRPPAETVTREVRRGVEARSRTALIFTAPGAAVSAEAVATLADALEARLRDVLREELGGTYTVTVRGAVQSRPEPLATVSIEFTSEPGRAASLSASVIEETARLARQGALPRQFDDAKAARLRDFEADRRQNGYLSAQLAQLYLTGQPPARLWHLPARVAALTPGDLQRAAQTLFGQGRYVRVTLKPE